MSSERMMRILTDVRAEREAAMAEVRKLDSVIQRLEELVGAGASEPASADATPPSAAAQPSSRFAAGVTALGAAEIVLREAGKPMRVRLIADALIAGGFPSPPAKIMSTLNSNLRRRGKIFVWASPGHFGLTEWKATEGACSQQNLIDDRSST
ncbi:MAG: hypothetical protein FJ290_30960 [Planctomycetes bacterium]|nr:hypothetical protein [Planctomycetota bacterium]